MALCSDRYETIVNVLTRGRTPGEAEELVNDLEWLNYLMSDKGHWRGKIVPFVPFKLSSWFTGGRVVGLVPYVEEQGEVVTELSLPRFVCSVLLEIASDSAESARRLLNDFDWYTNGRGVEVGNWSMPRRKGEHTRLIASGLH